MKASNESASPLLYNTVQNILIKREPARTS